MEKELITLTADTVKSIYEKLNVNPKRTQNTFEKNQIIPDEFEVYNLIAVDIEINGTEFKHIPAITISEDNSSYILVGYFLSKYTDKTTASKITNEGVNKGKFLVVNNKRIHPFTENLSEAEVVAEVLKIKKFKASKPTEFDVFQPEFVDGKPKMPATEAEALKRVIKKSYRVIYPVD